MECEILEDEVDLTAMPAMQDQRGDTKYPYQVSFGVSRISCCVFARLDLCL